MATGLIDVIKRASMEAMYNAQMCDLRFGKVTSTTPLKVQVTNQFTIPESLLIVPQHLTNYSITVDVDWITDDEGGHSHKIEGDRTMMIYGALKVGDKVALLRKTGGQSYFILDRI